jgi:hypothetical protein
MSDNNTPAFRRGVTEISSRTVESKHSGILDAFGRVRSAVNRLWTASTVEETLSVAAEEASKHFLDAALVGFVHRVGEGQWDHPFLVDRGIATRNLRVYEDLASSLTPAGFDEVALWPVLSEAGDLGTLDTYRATSIAEAYEKALVRHKLDRCVFVHARIRSRGGVIAGITIKHAEEYDYSEADRAVISAIASFTSLALS